MKATCTKCGKPFRKTGPYDKLCEKCWYNRMKHRQKPKPKGLNR